MDLSAIPSSPNRGANSPTHSSATASPSASHAPAPRRRISQGHAMLPVEPHGGADGSMSSSLSTSPRSTPKLTAGGGAAPSAGAASPSGAGVVKKRVFSPASNKSVSANVSLTASAGATTKAAPPMNATAGASSGDWPKVVPSGGSMTSVASPQKMSITTHQQQQGAAPPSASADTTLQPTPTPIMSVPVESLVVPNVELYRRMQEQQMVIDNLRLALEASQDRERTLLGLTDNLQRMVSSKSAQIDKQREENERLLSTAAEQNIHIQSLAMQVNALRAELEQVYTTVDWQRNVRPRGVGVGGENGTSALVHTLL